LDEIVITEIMPNHEINHTINKLKRQKHLSSFVGAAFV